VELAHEAIAAILARGRRVIVCGGTGLYIRALTKGLVKIPAISEKTKLKVAELAEELAPQELHRRLAEVDPRKARRLPPSDLKRVARALEVYYETGRPLSDWQREHGFSEERYDCLKMALYRPRRELYRVIERRVDEMLERGWLDEVKRLWARGLGYSPTARWAIGYRHLFRFFERGGELDACTDDIKRDTKRYAKRQLQWFKGEGDFAMYRYPDEYPAVEQAAAEFWKAE